MLLRRFSQLVFSLALVAGSLGFAHSASANQVQAAVEGSHLVIRGDNLGNQITISQNTVQDVVVRGLNGTLVNGRTSVVFRRTALQQVEILMAGGNDIVTLSNVAITNDLYVNLGAGNDSLRSSTVPCLIEKSVTVESGTGTDTVNLTGWQIGQDFYLDGQTGVLRSTLSGLSVYGVMTIIGDASNDQVSLSGCSAGMGCLMELGLGNDRVTVSDFLGFALAISTGEGADRIDVTGADTVEDFSAISGPQNDIVNLAGVASGKNVFVATDIGDDAATAVSVSAQYDAVFEGGDGVDSLTDLGITAGVKVEIKDFEIFP